MSRPQLHGADGGAGQSAELRFSALGAAAVAYANEVRLHAALHRGVGVGDLAFWFLEPEMQQLYRGDLARYVVSRPQVRARLAAMQAAAA